MNESFSAVWHRNFHPPLCQSARAFWSQPFVSSVAISRLLSGLSLNFDSYKCPSTVPHVWVRHICTCTSTLPLFDLLCTFWIHIFFPPLNSVSQAGLFSIVQQPLFCTPASALQLLDRWLQEKYREPSLHLKRFLLHYLIQGSRLEAVEM